MAKVQEILKSKLVTIKDVKRVQFTSKSTHTISTDSENGSKWPQLISRDWYDANEVDDFLDDYVSTTIKALGRDAIDKYIEKSKHYIVIDNNGNKVFESDSRVAADSAIDSIKRFKEELSKDIPDDFLKGTQFDTGDDGDSPNKSI